MMETHAYLFEARSIQSYILDSGRLNDMTQASERVDVICGELLDKAMTELKLEDASFMRRAGGAFTYINQDRQRVERFRDVWSLLVSRFVPGMEWVHCLASGQDVRTATQQGFIRLAQARNTPATVLPEAGPFAERSPRTGQAAAGRRKKSGAVEMVDAATLSKFSSWRGGANPTGHSTLGSKFLPGGKRFVDGYHHVFPRNLEADADEADQEAFPFLDGRQDIAILHADGNSMGIILRRMAESLKDVTEADYLKTYRAFSEAIGAATIAAARVATQEILFPAAQVRQRKDGKLIRVLPARPLVLGGDDLSLILRADLAVPYASTFLTRFEQETTSRLGALTTEAANGLTACAGLVFIKSSQPFAQAYSLAEALCQHAKDEAAGKTRKDGVKPSGLAFYRVSSSYFEDYREDILERVEKVSEGGRDYRLTYGAYGLVDQPVDCIG